MTSFKEISDKSHPYLKGVDYYNNTEFFPMLLVSPYPPNSYEDNEWHLGFFDAKLIDHYTGRQK